jgi:hypothetical protein
MKRSRQKNQESFAGRAAISFVINNGINHRRNFLSIINPASYEKNAIR